MNPRCTPERIRHGEFANQGSHVVPHTRTPGAASAFPGPVPTEATPVPADDGLRPDNVKSRTPAAPCPREPHPQRPVCRCQAEALPARPIDHHELVSQRENLKVQGRARSGQEPKRVEQGDEDGRHDSTLPENACNINQCNAYGVSGRHNRAFFKTGECHRLSPWRGRCAVESTWRRPARKAPEEMSRASLARR